MKFKRITDLIGNTPVLRLHSLSELLSSDLYLKCEFMSPGGSVKDRAALQMIKDAVERGDLKPGMSVVEGTAGNTGIGLSLVAKAYGFGCSIVMPTGQAIEKENLIRLYGADLHLVPPTKFADPKHFYHTARAMAEAEPKKYWWANQFENLSNFKAHYEGTGPEIFKEFGTELSHVVSVAGSGGTIGGVTNYLKEKNPNLICSLIDPMGSGLRSYFQTGQFVSEGNSFSEGIGIMRLTENFKKAKVDNAYSISDEDAVCVAHYLREKEGVVLGTSAALNVAGMIHEAVKAKKSAKILSFWCDQGDRSFAKLYNDDFLATQGIKAKDLSMNQLIEKYRSL